MSSKENMNKQAYFQGGGGVNEPTPGKPKYEKDKLNEELRNKGDKHMVGQPPFPGVGDVKGLHPSPASADEKDEKKRKELLARAEKEERAIRRQAAVEKAKLAYFQGGGGVNEPTPGKPKYEKDKLNEELRNKGDKHMVGQSPFPGVGDVKGLHPSPASADDKDELARKEKLSRASLKAKLVKVAGDDGEEDLGKTSWQVFQDGKLVLTASFDDLTGGNGGLLYDQLATKEFATKVLTKVRDLGVKQASAELFKKAQGAPVAPAAPGLPEAAPPVDPGMSAAMPPAPMPEVPSAMDAPFENVQDQGGAGDKAQTAGELATAAVEVVSDLKEAVDALEADKKEATEVAGALPAEGKTASLNRMRKSLASDLISGMKTVIAELNDGIEEMGLISSAFDGANISSENSEFVDNLAEEAFSEMKEVLAKASDLKKSFVKYAYGTKELVKRAEEEMEDMSDMDDVGSEVNDLKLEELLESLSKDTHKADDHEEDLEDVHMADTVVKTKEEADKALDAMKPGDTVKMASDTPQFDLSTKAGRDAMRAKLAADMDYNEVLDEAHPKGGADVEVDSKVSGNLNHVEDLVEQQKADLEVATAPVKVRKEAERLHKLISSGKIASSDLDGLISQGLDKSVVDYYKKYFGELGAEGKAFAAGLTEEHKKAKASEEMNSYRVKVARAYEMANEMVRKGLLEENSKAVAMKVDEIMKWNDDAFDSMKRMLNRHASAVVKQASKLPQIGHTDSFDGLTATAGAEDLVAELTRAFSSKNRGF